ncbi:MAG TPA: ABC transporter ATP-binding protein [Candidatus Saccharimonadales bacterium]|nr:ABC transporter ATP-binding protein [Candidatus Saccharimonadales bacterium]
MLRVRDLALGYGAEPVIEGVNLEVASGKFVSLVGPSGSGKTSILRAVNGLLTSRSGSVEFDGGRDQLGFLFQDDALLPWRTAVQNVALGLRIRNIAKAAAQTEADAWLARLGLKGFGGRFPHELSGGQRKRVAIAQILALKPKLLLMDEPFASLDAIVRTRITQELLNWVEREHLSVLLVTHDLEEALTVSDTVYLLSQGPSARVVASYNVGIPRPRDVFASRKHADFAPLLERLWNDMSGAMDGAEFDAQR